MKYLLSLLLFITPLIAEELTLEVPKCSHPILISLPSNFNPAKKHPTIFYYHGKDEAPSTKYMRKQAGDKDWIIVGMSYIKSGNYKSSDETYAVEKAAFEYVRNIMIEEHATNPSRLFVSGFSKGAFHAELLLLSNPSINGGIILDPGHRYFVPKSLSKYRYQKPIHIAVGQNDKNFLFALKSYLTHRRLGADVTLEEWPNHGRSLPKSRSESLSQWFKLRNTPAAKIKTLANEKIATAIKKADYLEFPIQWARLIEIQQMPYYSRADAEIQKALNAQLAFTKQDPVVIREAGLYSKRRFLLYQENTSTSILSLQKIAFRYKLLANSSPRSHQGKLLKNDAERLRELLLTVHQSKKPSSE